MSRVKLYVYIFMRNYWVLIVFLCLSPEIVEFLKSFPTPSIQPTLTNSPDGKGKLTQNFLLPFFTCSEATRENLEFKE